MNMRPTNTPLAGCGHHQDVGLSLRAGSGDSSVAQIFAFRPALRLACGCNLTYNRAPEIKSFVDMDTLDPWLNSVSVCWLMVLQAESPFTIRSFLNEDGSLGVEV